MAILNSRGSGPGTVVGANVKLQGQLRDTEDIIVHGQVDGEVASDKNVTISDSATVKGPVAATIVTVGGTVRGSIEAREKLEILPTGKVIGSIATKELTIKPGAIFNGRSSMGGKSLDKEPKKDKTVEKPIEQEEASEKNLDYEIES
ncbi:polymer-forming cytoskeletal protein [Candidatus Berkelbacteria bacterium]|nr:polymer-forming cytoskeletal protein [Candidatus Berkelbacteria bacterium]